MYKVVTVNCSSQYSGCKCIWTFHYCHKSGINITDISYIDCKISWMSFCPIIFAKLPHDIKQRKCVWCVFMYSMFSAIDVRLDPNNALHGSDQSNTSLWADWRRKQISLYLFVLFVFHSEIDLTLTSSLFHVGVIFIDARHAFYQQSHCVKLKHWTLHFCLLRAFIL